MFALGSDEPGAAARVTPDLSDVRMVDRLRLMLAVCALLAVLIDPEGLSGVSAFSWLVFMAYTVHCLGIYLFGQLGFEFAHRKTVAWLDVGWYSLMVLATGGANSFFFLFFFFAILTASFRWGFEEGARVTIASSVLFIACALVTQSDSDLPRLLLRTSFLLTIGYIGVRFGESEIILKQRLALLRDVSRLSNPRFGVDHTVTTVLDKARKFFKAKSCILVMRDDCGRYWLRSVNEGRPKTIQAQPIDAVAAMPLLATPPDRIFLYTVRRWLSGRDAGASHLYDCSREKWRCQRWPWRRQADRAADGQEAASSEDIVSASASGEQLAEMLDAGSFICVPLPLRRGEGRLYITSRARSMRKADALFLSQLAAQAFPVIEHIELLDRMVSEAALQERKKIALDLHDTAIQPYIGLSMALSAVRNQAQDDNPLLGELDKLSSMAVQVIADLRRYAGNFGNDQHSARPFFLNALRQQLVQVKQFYGIDIVLSAEGEFCINDRLAVEVLQIVREGLSNICKHTHAHRGCIHMQCSGGWLRIRIENERDNAKPAEFVPRSITQRAAALGGQAHIAQDGAFTAVCIVLPI